MSGILGGGRSAARESAAAAERQMAMQRKQLDRQEKQMRQEQSDLAMRTQASLRARQRGGQRMLMGDIDEESTLG
jgi:hypothetical protein